MRQNYRERRVLLFSRTRGLGNGLEARQKRLFTGSFSGKLKLLSTAVHGRARWFSIIFLFAEFYLIRGAAETTRPTATHVTD